MHKEIQKEEFCQMRLATVKVQKFPISKCVSLTMGGYTRRYHVQFRFRSHHADCVHRHFMSACVGVHVRDSERNRESVCVCVVMPKVSTESQFCSSDLQCVCMLIQ